MSRRGNGEGTVYRRKDGRCVGAFYVLRPNGGRVRRAVYGLTRAEASKRLAEMVAKTAAGVPLAVEAWTVERYAAHWLATVVKPRLRPSTYASYRDTLRLHIVPVLGRYALQKVTPADVRRLLADKSETGLSVRSVQIVHATLRVMLAEAVRDELLERNVASIVRGPSETREEVRPWSFEEAERFLIAASEDRLYALFAVGVALGLRRGELLGLRWADVDLEAPVLRVRQQIQRIYRAGLITGPPKSSRSRWDIPMPAFAVRVLREHRMRQAEERLALGPYWVDSGLVFTSTVGTALEPRNLTRVLDELQLSAGVRRIRFHDLRHTCASLLMAQGVPPRVVMDVLGHSQFSITMDLYSHVMPSALQEAAEAMDRALGGGR